MFNWVGRYLAGVKALEGKNAPTTSLNTQKKLNWHRINMLYWNILGVLFGLLQWMPYFWTQAAADVVSASIPGFLEAWRWFDLGLPQVQRTLLLIEVIDLQVVQLRRYLIYKQ